MPDYPRIEDHGVIGDLKTVALVDVTGRIDFMCYPDFDSPTVFASLLDQPDRERGLRPQQLAPSGEHLGNFPQALTHLSLISAAYAINRALDEP